LTKGKKEKFRMQPEVFNGGLVIYDDGNLTQDPQGCPIVILGVEGLCSRYAPPLLHSA